MKNLSWTPRKNQKKNNFSQYRGLRPPILKGKKMIFIIKIELEVSAKELVEDLGGLVTLENLKALLLKSKENMEKDMPGTKVTKLEVTEVE